MSSETIYQEISKLPNFDKVMIIKKLMTEVTNNLNGSKINFFDIQGVGKDLWKNIDAQSFVDNEREQWN